jgi:hypothetical protein
MSSAPAGSSGSGTGSTANVFTPAGQPAAGDKLNSIISGLPTTASGTPAGQYYPLAQDFLANYITGNTGQDQMITGAQTASDFTTSTAFPQTTSDSAALSKDAQSVLPYSQTALTNANDPQYTTNVTAAEKNPYYAPALKGAQQAADIGTAGASTLASDANQTLNTAYDPQGALYKQGQTGALDYANVANSMSGVSGTPYGSSVSANALTNYDLNWQDKQLSRQEGALKSADTALTDASKLAYTSSGYPSSVYTKNITDINAALKARDAASLTGAETSSSILGQAGTADATAASLDSAALKDLSTYTSLPYNTNTKIADTNLTGINDVTNLGNSANTSLQQTVSDLESYLGLGQSASKISGDLGATGLSELSSATQGIGSAASTANTLFGTGSSGSSSGSGLLSNLFGSGSGAGFTTAGDTISADALAGTSAITDAFGGATTADAGATAALAASV